MVTRVNDEVGDLVRSPLWLRDRSQSSIVALEHVLVEVLDGSHGGADLDVDVRIVPEGESWAVRNDPPIVHPPTTQQRTSRTYRVRLGEPVTEVEIYCPLARLRGPPSAVDGIPVLRGDGLILEVVGLALGTHAIPLARATAGTAHHARNYPVE